MGMLGKATGSGFDKSSSYIALTILLFMSVYLSIGLLLNGVVWLGTFFVLSACTLVAALIGNQPTSSSNPMKLSAVLSVWLGLLFILWSRYDLTLAWFYVCNCSVCLVVDAKSASRINGIGLVILSALMLERLGLGVAAAETLPLLLVAGLVNYTNHQLKFLKDEAEGSHTIDALTGCANRRSLQNEMEKAAGLRRRYQVNMSAVTLKIEGMDTLLEAVGDKTFDAFLVELTQVWKSRLRQTDTLCRQSDDTFIGLLPSTNSDNALLLARDLVNASEAYEYNFTEKVKVSHRVVEHDGDEKWEDWYKKLLY